MSTGRKWFLALTLVSAFSFFMFMFPTTVDSAVRGSDVWLVPGYHGSVEVDTGVKAINWNWSGTLTLTAGTSDGTGTVTARKRASQDWDETLVVKNTIGPGPKPLHVWFTVTLPDQVREGTELTATVTGDIVTPQYSKGGYTDVTSTVDKHLTFHVADKAEVTRHSDETQRWPLAPWSRWLLLVPLVLFVLTTERVSIRIARRINA
jgi:hypothetical protein